MTACIPRHGPNAQRNARGQGARLTEDIVSGALALIEREGTDEAVTLRAVAREIGIAAPSIYAHFPDRAAIMLAVVARVFDELTQAISQARRGAADDPVERLVAGCEAYVAFGLRTPARYRVLFSEQRLGERRLLEGLLQAGRRSARVVSCARVRRRELRASRGRARCVHHRRPVGEHRRDG